MSNDTIDLVPHPLIDMPRFLLASLNLEAILQESTIHRRQERLRKIKGGLGLGDAYGATIERIKAQDGDKSGLGIAALMWISHAQRPLRADDLCQALAVELGSMNFNFNNIPSITTLVGCCQGLITVDKEASTVRLIHFTLQEYLSTSPDIFSSPHATMAETCLTYLNSEEVRVISADRSPDVVEMSFLKYCSLYWGVHAKMELSDRARSLALQLLKACDGHISIKSLLEEQDRYDYWYLAARDMGLPFTGLHWASFFGVAELVDALIEARCYDANAGDFLGHTPLALAARSGHEEVVKMLLQRGQVSPNKPDNRNRTPLRHAAQQGHEGVVKILLAYEEVNPHKPHSSNPHKPHSWSETPVWQAAIFEDEKTAKLLLECQELTPDVPDNSGRTLLSCAALLGYERVVKVLLGREEVNPDKPDNWGRTPLSYAAGMGREEIVKILLGREEVNPEMPNNTGKTPLSYAAEYGREGVVKLLLGREDVNPHTPDCTGTTPLMCAVRAGHKKVIAQLQPH